MSIMHVQQLVHLLPFSFTSSFLCRGVKSVVVEKRQTTSDSARAVLLNTRSMEHLRRLGLEKKFQQNSYPRNQSVNIGVCNTLLGGTPFFEFSISSWGDFVDGKKGFTMPAITRDMSVSPSMMCPQFTQEPLLKEHLETRSECTMLWGWQATSIVEDQSGVFVKIKSVSGDDEKQFQAKYVFGCDGGKSWIRKHLNLHTYGKFVVQRACSITFQSASLLSLMKEKNNNRMGLFAVALNKKVIGAMITLNDKGDFAFHCIFPPDTSDEEMNDLRLNPSDYVRAAIGRPDVPFVVKQADLYNMHALISSKYREGQRILLAGDAAHQWLPIGGLGLNTGIGDAADLAWKIAAVLQGWGGDHLLDSYQIERAPVADTCRRIALSPTEMPVLMRGNVLAGIFRIPGIQFLASKAVGTVISLEDLLKGANDAILFLQYSTSNIICHEKPKNQRAIFSLPGKRAPHVALSDYPTILDLFGKGFVLLVLGGEEHDCESLQEALKLRGVPFDVHVFPRLPELVQVYDMKYYLIRPDGIIAWRANYQPSQAEANHNIVPVICGDKLNRPQPKPLPSPVHAPSFSFLFNVGVGSGLAAFLHSYRSLSVRSAIIFGVAAATFLHYFRGRMKRQRPPFIQEVSRHKAWVTNQFGHAMTSLQLEPRFITSFGPKDVVIRVHAASINRIDVGMRQGYASSFVKWRAADTGQPIFPFVLGRDCSGEVVTVGDDVRRFVPGDQVYAAISPLRNGSHAEYVCVSEDHVSQKPRNVDHKEAASLPWVAVTVWQALVQHGGLNESNTGGKRVLVHAGSGGVGCFAIQLLKAWGAHVTTTCSGDNIKFVHALGADVAIDYTSGDYSSTLSKHSFDVILDPMHYERSSIPLLKLYGGARYVSLRSSLHILKARFGNFFGGLLHEWLYRFKVVSNRICGSRGFYYSIAQPSGDTLATVAKMVESGEIKPVLGAVYSMDEMVAAHQHVEGGHTRGKVVVSMIA